MEEARRQKGKRTGNNANEGKFPPCSHCKKTTHLKKYCWYKLDIKCRFCKQLGYIKKMCKNKNKQLQGQQARVVDD